MSLYRDPDGRWVSTALAATMCSAPGCPASRVHEVEVEVNGKVLDEGFCNHHLNKYEAGLLIAMGVEDSVLVGAPS